MVERGGETCVFPCWSVEMSVKKDLYLKKGKEAGT